MADVPDNIFATKSSKDIDSDTQRNSYISVNSVNINCNENKDECIRYVYEHLKPGKRSVTARNKNTNYILNLIHGAPQKPIIKDGLLIKKPFYKLPNNVAIYYLIVQKKIFQYWGIRR